MRINGVEYISLTDLARYADNDEPRLPIRDWMRNKDVISFLGLWEEIHNENFKLAESREFKNDSATQSFTISPSRWIKLTNAKGFISKRGKYDGGTFAHPDIALEFASWIDSAFKLYLIKEFERLKHKGNIRDYTDLLHLVILSNLENINAELIGIGASQSERLIKLNNIARRQMELLSNNKYINNVIEQKQKDE